MSNVFFVCIDEHGVAFSARTCASYLVDYRHRVGANKYFHYFIYVALFIPMGMMLMLCRYDPLQRHFNKAVESYRIVRELQLDKSSLENPF